MARALIVGCGCRGRALAGALAGDGHSVRGTTRLAAGLSPIGEAGAEGVLADPDRLGTILVALEGVSVVCWLMGSAVGQSAPDVNGPRLESLLERLVDTPVRGLVYEGAGAVDGGLLAGGAELVRAAGERWMMPVAVVDTDPAEHAPWLAAMRRAVADLIV